MKKLFIHGCLIISILLLAGCGGRCYTCYHKPVAQLAALRKQGVQVVSFGDTVRIIMPSDTFFKFNSPQLRPSRIATLQEIAHLLHGYRVGMVHISGYTDNVGSQKHKDNLSTQQAKTITAYLWNSGIKLAKIGATGYGDKMPIASNRTMWGSAHNRRVEIFVRYYT